jgi:uncharacterized coiled-coil protein SlyX
MNTFRNEQYTITTSLADHNIIVNVVNNISCVEYERIFNPRAIGLPFGLDDAFRLINKCFEDPFDLRDSLRYAPEISPVNPRNLTAARPDFFAVGSSKAEIEVIQNTGAEHLTVKFYYIVDGLLETHFIVRLAEKRVAAGDKGLILEMNRQKQMITDLTGTVEQMRVEMERQKQYILELLEKMDKITG